MTSTRDHDHSPKHANALVGVSGKLGAVSVENRRRLSAFLVRGGTVFAEAPVNRHGVFRFHLASDLARAKDVFAVLGPKGMDTRALAGRTDLPRVALSAAHTQDGGAVTVEFPIDDELIDPWWIWCRDYTISGTLDTVGGCPIGATVTIYNVTTGLGGLTRSPLASVTTDANGNFTATFNWCSQLCWWPCWPVWWDCWPWWWELDILALLENVERQVQARSPATAIARFANVAPLRQPLGPDLMTGVGFAGARAAAPLQPDSARTALIASKFANPAIREIFPWWWWCCENPNIVFSATQGATTILDEDPNFSTRWCFDSGQTVLLTGNSQSIGACPLPPPGENCAFAWTSVGADPGGVAVGSISMGYAEGSGGACSNLAFAGTLNLNGVFAGTCAAFYQVLAGQWGGDRDPARAGTAPAAAQPLALPQQLVNQVSIWRDATSTVEVDNVVLGPFNFNLNDNLYVTPLQRQTGGLDPSIIAQIGAVPALGVGDFVIGWSAPDLVLTAGAGELIGGASVGGVTLSLLPFDIGGNPIPPPPGLPEFDLGPPLTLLIDTTGLSNATIDSVTVYNADGSLASQTAASSTACPAYQITTPGGGYALVHTTVTDGAGHLCEYFIQTQYGDGSLATATPSDRDYAQAPASFSAAATPPPFGVDGGYGLPNNLPPPPPAPQTQAPSNWTFSGGGDTIYIPIAQSCCYDFQLWVSKRTTDGQTFACSGYNADFQTVNITVAA